MRQDVVTTDTPMSGTEDNDDFAANLSYRQARARRADALLDLPDIPLFFGRLDYEPGTVYEPEPGGGTGKSHSLIAFGVAAVQSGYKVCYFTAADLVETLYRGLADNSVGRVIENLLRADLVILDEVGFAPLDDTGPNCWFGSSPPPTNTPGRACPPATPSPG